MEEREMNTNDTSQELFVKAMNAFVEERLDKSIEFLDSVLEKDADHVMATMTRGSAYLKLNRLKEALDDFDRVVKCDPAHAGGFHKRGLVKEKMGQYTEAMQDFDKAIALEPEYGAAYYSRAALHGKLSQEDEALKDIEMVTHLGNRNLETFMGANNIWHTQQMRVEDATETELNR